MGSFQDTFTNILKRCAELDALIVERRSRIEVLKSELEAIDKETESAQKKLEWIESEMLSKEKELELLHARKRDQEQQFILLDEVRAQLRNEVKKADISLQQKGKYYSNTLAKYDAIWENHQEKYNRFPRVAERNYLQRELNIKEIRVKILMQQLEDKMKQSQQLEKIRALQGKILTSEVQDLYVKHQELIGYHEKLENENKEIRKILKEKKIEKEDQRKKQEEEKLLSQTTAVDGTVTTNEDLDNAASKTLITLQDIPVLSIPDFDSVDDITQTQLPYVMSFSNQFQPPSRPCTEVLVNEQAPTCNSQQTAKAVHHFAIAFEETAIGTETAVALEKCSNVPQKPIQEEPSTTTEKESAVSLRMDKECLGQTFYPSSCQVQPVLGEIHTPTTPCTASHKKEQMIKTDKIVAKLRDLVKHTNDDRSIVQKNELLSFQSISERGPNQDYGKSDALELTYNAFGGRCIEDEVENDDMTSKQREESDPWAEGELGGPVEENNMELEKKQLSPNRSPTADSKEDHELCAQDKDDSYAFGTDYPELYDENSFEPPPNFGQTSTSESDVDFTSPLLSPRPDNLESASIINDEKHQPFGFSFFSSTSNIFGGSNNPNNSEEPGKSNSKSFFLF